jgi:hypothetical protein
MASTKTDWHPFAGAAALTSVFLVILPCRRRLGTMLAGIVAMVLMVFLTGTIGCSGKSGSAGSTGSGSEDAKPGVYTVVITGTSATGSIHPAALTVVVQ